MSKFKNRLLASVLIVSGFTANAEILFKQSFLDSMMSEYSDSDKERVEADLQTISKLVLGNVPSEANPVYLATAGAPGAHKTTILETVLKEDPRFSQMAYIDPDARALRFMIHSYLSQSLNFYEISKAGDFQSAQKSAYTHWRTASNYIANSLLETALSRDLKIAHGTTLTGDKVPVLLSKIKAAHYKTVLLLCHAPDEVRVEAAKHRAKVMAFYQSTEEDIREKGQLFLQRIPTYFEFADELHIYWTGTLFHSVKAAEIISGDLKILDPTAYEAFVTYLNTQQNSEHYWEELLKAHNIHEQSCKI